MGWRGRTGSVATPASESSVSGVPDPGRDRYGPYDGCQTYTCPAPEAKSRSWIKLLPLGTGITMACDIIGTLPVDSDQSQTIAAMELQLKMVFLGGDKVISRKVIKPWHGPDVHILWRNLPGRLAGQLELQNDRVVICLVIKRGGVHICVCIEPTPETASAKRILNRLYASMDDVVGMCQGCRVIDDGPLSNLQVGPCVHSALNG